MATVQENLLNALREMIDIFEPAHQNPNELTVGGQACLRARAAIAAANGFTPPVGPSLVTITDNCDDTWTVSQPEGMDLLDDITVEDEHKACEEALGMQNELELAGFTVGVTRR